MRKKPFILIGAAILAVTNMHQAFAGDPTGAPGMVPQHSIFPSVAAASPNGAQSAPGTINSTPGRPVAYQDPARGYMLVAPPDARFQERPGGQQIAIQSRKGYGVNIQTGDANPGIATPAMFYKLEQNYLGDGKPWSRKVGEGSEVVAGLPAGVAVYEAGSTKTKVVIARGKQTDFVFMFFAPISHFEKLTAEFEWILASFRPAPNEKPDEPAKLAEMQEPQAKQPPLRAENDTQAIPAGRPQPEQSASAPDVIVFSEAGYGYRVEYPSAWQFEKLSAFTNAISGPRGTPAYDAIVSLQNVKPAGEGNVARLAIDNLKSSLSELAQGVQFVGEKPVIYAKYGLKLEGHQFVANYIHQGQPFRKWALVLPRPEGGIAHIWSYTAPVKQFDAYRPIAERILNSLKIDDGQG
jgi:hypothetical protein